jgi:hypothetical protein
MSLSDREVWALIHGIIFGSLFLLAYTGSLVAVYVLRSWDLTPQGVRSRLSLTRWATTIMAILAWATVATGTYIVYPWYRARPPEGTTDLTRYPRSFLLEDPNLSGWHTFAMEWKEHVAWFAPILATAVAYLAWRYGRYLSESSGLRKVMMITLTIAFVTAAVAGLLGALITKAAPVR